MKNSAGSEMARHFLIRIPCCRRQVMVGGGGEKSSPTAFYEKVVDKVASVASGNAILFTDFPLSLNYMAKMPDPSLPL